MTSIFKPLQNGDLIGDEVVQTHKIFDWLKFIKLTLKQAKSFEKRYFTYVNKTPVIRSDREYFGCTNFLIFVCFLVFVGSAAG